ncbi:MAG TPA: secondary thiamine-phosphate synthase enzyme YjbQ [Rhodanobacter sp.]|nr:secondary thiamine-phosphate synthase enzyme YjbQ [Rhodanobacter sp.]
MIPPPHAPGVAQGEFVVRTGGRGFSDITREVADAVAASRLQAGVAHVFTTHTSCSLLLGENADPTVREDLERWFARAVPDGDPIFRHDAEGPDDMPAHVRSILTGVSLQVPVRDGALLLGTWQGIYLWEHRHAPHRRRVVVTVLGAPAA